MSPKILLALCGVATAAQASALQPLDEFLRAARTGSADNAEARAVRRQVRAEADAALGRALPSLSLRGEYTRNELESTLTFPDPGGGPATTVTLTPRHQLDGIARLDVPLVDLASFARVGAARTSARASAREEQATALRVQALVSQDYYQLVANLALVASSRRALDVAKEGQRIATQRHQAGTGTLLDVDRAAAEVERNVQQVAGAELQASLVARALQSRTGISPLLDAGAALADALQEPPPLERFQPPDEQLPALAAAMESRAAAEQEARAQRLTLVPSLGASLTERVTDFEGLAGQEATWQAVSGSAGPSTSPRSPGSGRSRPRRRGRGRGSSVRGSRPATTSTRRGCRSAPTSRGAGRRGSRRR